MESTNPLNTLRVDVRALLRRARSNDWLYLFVSALAKVTGRPMETPVLTQALIDELPAEVGYLELRPRLSGALLLDLIECLVGVDHRVGGLVLLNMARELFAPQVSVVHPAKGPTDALLDDLQAYLLDEGSAEAYIGAAFRYRSQYGTTITAINTEPVLQFLFEAMPSGGLCCPIGEGRWHLVSHWQSFGRFLACQTEAWMLLDEIDDELADIDLVPGDENANCVAVDTIQTQIFDQHRDDIIGRELDDYVDDLNALIDRILPAAVDVARVEA